MQPTDCCSPCPPQVPSVAIPGPQGPAGAAGTNGTNGINAFTTTTAQFNVPPDTVTPVTISVVNSTWVAVGEFLKIGQGAGAALANPGPATFKVTAVPSPNNITMLWQNFSGDVAAGTPISSGAVVTPTGQLPATPITIAQGGTNAITKAAAQTNLGLGQDSLVSSGAGLAQAITAANVQVGAIDIQLTAAGTYELRGFIMIDFAGTTFVASRTITCKIRNITQGVDICNGVMHTQTQATLNFPTQALPLPPFKYSAGVANDHLQMFVIIDVINSAGTLSVDAGSLEAIPLRLS